MAESNEPPNSDQASKSTRRKPTRAATTAARVGGPGPAAVASGVSRVRRAVKRRRRASGSPTSVVKACWLIGLVLMWVYPVIKPNPGDDFGKWIVRQLAWTAVYVGLLIIAAFGAARAAAGFAVLTVLMLMLAPHRDRLPFGSAVLGAMTRLASSNPRDLPSKNMTPWFRDMQAGKAPPGPPPAPDPEIPLPVLDPTLTVEV